MGKRSGTPETSEDVEKLTLEEINGYIAWYLREAFSSGHGSSIRKQYFQRLIWMEDERARLFDIPAPKRKFTR